MIVRLGIVLEYFCRDFFLEERTVLRSRKMHFLLLEVRGGRN